MISWKKRGIVLCLILPLALVGCAEKQKEGEGELTPVPEENRLTLFTSHKPEVYQPILVEFENRTGIIVDVTAGGTTERMEEIENFAIGSVDVMFGGGEESYAAYADCFTPYETDSRENLDPKIFTEDAVWTPFSELPLVLIYNTRLVDEDDAPKGWEDLLTGKAWTGKVAFANPHNSGTSVTILTSLPQILKWDPGDCIDLLAAQVGGDVLSGSGDVVDAVEMGTKSVGITLEETAKKRMAQGAHIGIVYPKEGTCNVPDAAAIVKKAPHEENAKAFLDFTVSTDIQQMIQDEMYRRSVRTDLTSDWEKPIHVVPFDLSWAVEHQGELMQLWDTTMGTKGGAEDA